MSCSSACMCRSSIVRDGDAVRVSGFILRSEKQIDVIKKYCKHVFVDPEKEDLAEAQGHAGGSAASIRGNTVYKDSASLDVELPRARTAITQTTSVLRQISPDVQVGHAVDGAKVKQAASDITESVVRNPDAATLLCSCRRRAGNLQPGDTRIGDDEHFRRFCSCRARASNNSACSDCCRMRASSNCRLRCWKSGNRSARRRRPCSRRMWTIRSKS